MAASLSVYIGAGVDVKPVEGKGDGGLSDRQEDQTITT
jgi:hypothetical protein